MSSKILFVVCAQALLIQSALSQIIAGAPCGIASPYSLGAPTLGLASPAWPYAGYAQALDFTPTSGGGLPVSSASAIAPVGISVASDNVYEGALAVAGELPFVGTVGLQGALPTAGAGAVNHQCGNGINAMASGPAAYAPAAYALAAYASAIAPFAAPAVGYSTGCGCGGLGYAY